MPITGGTFWLFLLVTLVVYWSVPVRARRPFIALASFVYLCTLDLFAALGCAGSSVFVFVVSRPKHRTALAANVSLPLSALAYFKFRQPVLEAFGTSFVDDLLLPLGISYFTFKLIHFAIEVHRGRIKDKDLPTFLAFMLLFPTYFAGPIERYDRFDRAFSDTLDRAAFGEGGTRIIQGLIKKFIVADWVQYRFLKYPSADVLMSDLASASTARIWWHLAWQFAHAYLDFSAYSDIAIGIARLFGIRITENFNFPIFARNVSDFWRRWHMSLTSWCQTYVQMPTMIATRNPYFAALVTMLTIGLWHKASACWAIWGLYHGLGICVFQAWRARFKPSPNGGLVRRGLATVATLTFVISSWAWLLADSRGDVLLAVRLYAKLFYLNV